MVFLLDLLPYGLDYALFSRMDLSKVSVPFGFFMSYNEWLNQLELRVNHTLYRLYTIPQKIVVGVEVRLGQVVLITN